jgi:hypothetical protein
MTRLLATIALFATLLAAPAWAQTMTPNSPHPATHAVHRSSSADASRATVARHRHHFVAGDDSAETLNRQVLQNLQKGG